MIVRARVSMIMHHIVTFISLATVVVLCAAGSTPHGHPNHPQSPLRRNHGRPRRIGGWVQADANPSRPSTVNCTWRTFDQKVDHFGDNSATWPQRYCMYSKYWKTAKDGGFNASKDAPGPILFYTGNESPVEEYINNTGLMWEIAEDMAALLIFAEHRYEPLSHPNLCGVGTDDCFSYCTTAQANADWAALITYLRTSHTIRAPAVAFGGSYGGMLSGWFRMKYPEVIDGAIAASAPIWQLASTVEKDTLDMQAVAITRGLSKKGGASDQCSTNLRTAWPLLAQVGQSKAGLALLSKAARTCSPLTDPNALPSWGQSPYFFMAEGNYPFPSTYITFSLLPGNPTPLPAWPQRVACESLTKDFGIKIDGSLEEVNFTLTMGDITVAVDWNTATGNGASLTEAQIKASGILDLASAVADGAGVWYNLTKDQKCFNVGFAEPQVERQSIEPKSINITKHVDNSGAKHCPACPPCDDCPPCPVSYCDWEADNQCTYCNQTLSKTFSWDGIGCNEALSQIDIHGVGRDIYWPPQVQNRNYTVESIVGPHSLRPSGCINQFNSIGLRGAPMIGDPWSEWMTAYYGGRNVSHHRNIVWSNGALDPWSGQGVYPPGGGPNGPMVQKINEDGSQISLVLDLGAHHLDLMFSDPRNPPCFTEARKIETQMIRQWCQEAYENHP